MWASTHGSLFSISFFHVPPPPPPPPTCHQLYITCCSDCTTGTLHMPKPAKPSLSKWGQGFKAQALPVVPLTLLWPHPLAWYCRSVWSWSYHCAACSSWSVAKFHWHRAWRSTCKSFIHGHVSCKRGGRMWELVVAPWTFPGGFHTSSDHYFTASTSRKHVIQVAEGSYHLQLIGSDLDFTLWSAINRVGISPGPSTPIIRIWCQSLWPCLMHPKFAAIAVDAVVAYSCTTDSAWVLAWTLQKVQACTTDHDLCLSCFYPQPLLLHGLFPYWEPPDTFLKGVSNDDKIICI